MRLFLLVLSCAHLVFRFRSIELAVSGTLAASYSKLANTDLFRIASTSVSGSLPSEFSGFGTFVVSDSLLSGSLPDMSLWLNVSVVAIAGNRLSGSFSVAFLPPKVAYFDASRNLFASDALLLNDIPATVSLLDLSYNMYKGLLLKLSDLRRPPSSAVMVLNLKGNQIFCPLPGKSDLINGLDLLVDPCLTDFSALLPYGAALATAPMVAVLLLLLLRCHLKHPYNDVRACLMHQRFHLFKFGVFYASGVYSMVTVAMTFNSMLLALAVVSPDNCAQFNLKQMWINNMPQTFGNLDGSTFPPPLSYSNFTTYAQLLLNGFPGLEFPAAVQQNINVFQARCVNISVSECAYNSEAFLCYCAADIAQSARDSFAKFMWASLALFATKEFIKLLAVLSVLLIPNSAPTAIAAKSVVVCAAAASAPTPSLLQPCGVGVSYLLGKFGQLHFRRYRLLF